MKRAAKSVGVGVVVAVLASFPLVALIALVFRFPVPFVGYARGLAAVPQALEASLFYGASGGYHLLLLIGITGGLIAWRRGVSDAHACRLSALFAVIGSAGAVFTLSILDKLIGPW